MIKKIETILGSKNIEVIDSPGFGEIPVTVYKYRSDWSNEYHKRILTNGEIYFASPEEFNDPFDCGIDIAFELLKTDATLRFNYFTDFVNRTMPHLAIIEKEGEVEKLIQEGRYYDDVWMNYVTKKNKKDLFDVFGVFCTTPLADNVLMWSHYANSHKGFCIGFDSNRLMPILKGRGGLVYYADDYPIISPLTNVHEQMFLQTNTKAKFWNYEIEYRFAKFNNSRNVVKVPPDCIKEVILGCAISKQHRNEIIEFTTQNLPHVKIYDATLRKRDFNLDLIDI